MRTVSALFATLIVSIGLVTRPPAPAELAPAESAPSDHSSSIEPADEVAAEGVPVSLSPVVTVVGADPDQRSLLDGALATFRANGLELPDVEVRYSDDEADCGGHMGLFQKKYTPWRLSVCSDFSFVPYHELAHAWEAANVDDATRARYIEARGLTTWNAADVRWAERGVEDAARMIQVNLLATHVVPEMPIWQERFEAYELLVGRPSPVLTRVREEIVGERRAEIATEPPSRPEVGPPTTCCRVRGAAPASRADGTPPVAVTSPDGDRGPRESLPDAVADHVGGTAARFFTADGRPVVGDVFLLMASGGSSAEARLYDRSPYTHDYGPHPDTVASNLLAARTVGAITGSEVDVLELTAAPGGGPSGGITRAIVYLNVLSDGAFTGDLRVAATGRLGSEGHISSIDHIDLKTAAAHLADADVLFTPTLPTGEVAETFGGRTVGEITREPRAGARLHDEHRLDEFRRWGASRSDGMDIVDARHLIDVAAYLCGAGSTYACDVTDLLDEQAQRRFDRAEAESRSDSERHRALQLRSASPGSDSSGASPSPRRRAAGQGPT